MLLGILSDTHGHEENTSAAAELFRQHDADLLIHCGDIGSSRIPSLLQSWSVHYVFGNVDRDRAKLKVAIRKAKHICHDSFGSLECEGRRIAFLHSDDAALFQSTIASGEWDLVCYGHTHKAESHTVGRTLVLNPGAVFRSRPHSVALVRLPQLEVTMLPF